MQKCRELLTKVYYPEDLLLVTRPDHSLMYINNKLNINQDSKLRELRGNLKNTI